QFRLVFRGAAARVGSEVAIAAYRLVQESLTNVVRHAGASEVQIDVEVAERLQLAVRDNGRNARQHAEAGQERYGLIGMRERAEALGGSFHWLRDGAGVCVTAQLPLRR